MKRSGCRVRYHHHERAAVTKAKPTTKLGESQSICPSLKYRSKIVAIRKNVVRETMSKKSSLGIQREQSHACAWALFLLGLSFWPLLWLGALSGPSSRFSCSLVAALRAIHSQHAMAQAMVTSHSGTIKNCPKASRGDERLRPSQSAAKILAEIHAANHSPACLPASASSTSNAVHTLNSSHSSAPVW